MTPPMAVYCVPGLYAAHRRCDRRTDAVTGVQTPCVPHSSRTRRTNGVGRVQGLYAAHASHTRHTHPVYGGRRTQGDFSGQATCLGALIGMKIGTQILSVLPLAIDHKNVYAEITFK